MSKNIDLTPKQVKAVELLAKGAANSAVAQALDINHNTVLRWRKIEAFAAKLHEIQTAAMSEVITAIRATAVVGVASLRDIMADTEVAASVRLDAAKAIIGFALQSKGTELDEVLSDLREAANAVNH